jgi:hypothetical protein
MTYIAQKNLSACYVNKKLRNKKKVFIKYVTATILYVTLFISNWLVLTFEPLEHKFEMKR